MLSYLKRFKQRSDEKEWLDLGSSYYTPHQYHDCLHQLAKIGRCLGGDRATFWGLNQLRFIPQSILDLGCGGGLFTLQLAKRYPDARILGIDLSEEAIAFANEQKERAGIGDRVEFRATSLQNLIHSEQFDLWISTLVFHHLEDEEIVDFLKLASHHSCRAFLINDLHRNPLASCAYVLVSPFLFRNRMLMHDGLISIRRSFQQKDWKRYLSLAGVSEECVKLSWRWPFRWILLMEKK